MFQFIVFSSFSSVSQSQNAPLCYSNLFVIKSRAKDSNCCQNKLRFTFKLNQSFINTCKTEYRKKGELQWIGSKICAMIPLYFFTALTFIKPQRVTLQKLHITKTLILIIKNAVFLYKSEKVTLSKTIDKESKHSQKILFNDRVLRLKNRSIIVSQRIRKPELKLVLIYRFLQKYQCLHRKLGTKKLDSTEDYKNNKSFLVNFFKVSQRTIEELVELSKLPKLENIEINLVNDVSSVQVIKNIKSLEYLELRQAWYKIKQMPTQSNNYVNKQLQKHYRQFVQNQKLKNSTILQKNPYFKTIIIKNLHENKNMNDETVECMTNLIKLLNLSISNNTEITGKNFRKLDRLIMLQIQN